MKFQFTLSSDDTEQPLQSIQPPAAIDDIKYIVFRSCLLELFISCKSCHNSCSGEVAYQKGTCIAIRQLCYHCGHKRVWMSQPFIKDVPAGNILLSGAILFSGATPGKVLRMLNHMQVACISDRTFYRHQSRFLEPAIFTVWKEGYWLNVKLGIVLFPLVVMVEQTALAILLSMGHMP